MSNTIKKSFELLPGDKITLVSEVYEVIHKITLNKRVQVKLRDECNNHFIITLAKNREFEIKEKW